MSQQRPQSESKSADFEAERKASKKFLHGVAQSLIQWMPLGGSGAAFLSFLLKQDWIMVVVTFPVMAVTVVWAAYTESFLTRLGERFHDRGRRDVDYLMTWLDNINQAIRWQLSGTEDKYLRCQSNACREYLTEGYRRGTFVPLLSEVFVPLELSSDFFIGARGEELPNLPGFREEDKDLIEAAAKNELKIWDLLAKLKQYPAFSRMAILALGGSGKTTLLRHITYVYANKRYRQYKAPKFLPVLILLRQWQEVIATETDLNLPKLIEKHHLLSLPEGAGIELPPQWAKKSVIGRENVGDV